MGGAQSCCGGESSSPDGITIKNRKTGDHHYANTGETSIDSDEGIRSITVTDTETADTAPPPPLDAGSINRYSMQSISRPGSILQRPPSGMSGMGSQISAPHKKVTLQHVITRKILMLPQFESSRNGLEERARAIEGINDVLYDVSSFIILSADKGAIHKASQILQLVAWRLPVIQAWAQPKNYKTYQRLMEKAKMSYKGIWLIINMDGFIRNYIDFTEDQQKTINSMPFVDNRSMDYLEQFEHIRNNSEEFKELSTKLPLIVDSQNQEIVIIGEQNAVERLIIDIRRHEITHPSVANKIRNTKQDPFKLTLGTPQMGRERGASKMSIYRATIENLPSTATESELTEFLSSCECKVITCRLVRNPKNREISSVVDFDGDESRSRIVQKADSEEGLVWKEHVLNVKVPQQLPQVKRRKHRRVTSGSQFF